MRRARRLALSLWLVLVAIAGLVVAHAHYSADLSAFLPRSPTATQQLLVQQLRDGLPSRLILIGIEGADAATRARASQALSAALRAEPAFVSISNGEAASEQRDQTFIFEHRYALSDDMAAERFSAAGLQAAIGDTLELLAAGQGLSAKELFRADPTGETLAVIDQLSSRAPPRREQGVWSSSDGSRALLIGETRAAGSDTDAQAAALALIRRAFSASAAAAAPATAAPAAGAPAAAPLRLLLSGPGVFSVAARATIEQQAVRLSLLSTALIVTLLLLVYRSLPTLLLGLLPVASGALAGVAAVALGFGIVHGITLGFGVTLIGESVDYSVYLFIQARGGGTAGDAAALRALWPTMALGVLTSVCGFASLLPSAFPGLAQLGLYSISGLAAAAAVTRWVLPALMPERLQMRDLAPLGAAVTRLAARVHLPLAVAAALALLCALWLYKQQDRLWNRDLAALSPVSAAALELDAQMRGDLGAPDIGDLVAISGASEQAVLQSAERVGRQLGALQADGVIGGFDSPARYLPSEATQRARLDALPSAPQLQARLDSVSAALGLQSDALAPFVQQVAQARSAAPITPPMLQGTSFALGLDALLWHQDGSWHALLPLHARGNGGGVDIARVRRRLAPPGGAAIVVLNIKHETDALYASYLTAAIELSLIGLGAILLLLALTLRSPRRVAAVIAPLVLAVLTVCAGLRLAGTRLTILHLIGLLLIVAVGSNYALFFDRRAAERERTALPLTLSSLLIANACTVIGFGVLAFSPVPVLRDLGQTVAPGTACALLFAALLAPRALFATAREAR
jgi:predicted exporter